MATILQSRTVLPVKAAAEGDRLVAGRVLVAPVGYHTLITGDRRISLIVSGEHPPYRPSADLLLTSLALATGSRAIAVVLSGYGNDGATGATAIHHHGGVVIASDEASSTVFVMPAATISRDEVIDRVLAVDDIAALLVKLASGSRPGDMRARNAGAREHEGSSEPNSRDKGPPWPRPVAQPRTATGSLAAEEAAARVTPLVVASRRLLRGRGPGRLTGRDTRGPRTGLNALTALRQRGPASPAWSPWR